MGGQVGRPTEAKVPFADHVGAVAQAGKGMRNIYGGDDNDLSAIQ